MRGREPGVQLEKVRAIKCARQGLSLVSDGSPSEGETERLLSLYKASPEKFVTSMAEHIKSLCDEVIETGDPASAVEITMVAGLLTDRMTTKALFALPMNDASQMAERARNGIVLSNGEKEFIPYSRKEGAL